MARTAVWVLALCFTLITSVLSDCPDRSYRCRAALTENFIKTNGIGCTVGAGAEAGADVTGPSAGVSVNGECYQKEETKNEVSFYPLGTMTAGHCYQYQFGDFTVDQSCRPCRPIPDVCADKVAGCKQCPKVCTSTYTTQPGDSCWSIANTAGITVEALLSLNPGVNCDTLQPNQQFCTAQGEGQCTNVCEGIQI